MISEQEQELRNEIDRLKRELEQALLVREAVMEMVKSSNAASTKFFQALWDEAQAAKTKPGFIRHTIWFMWMPGQERTYALTTQPSGIWADIQKKAGYFIASFEIEIPDVANFTTGVQHRVEEPTTSLVP
jgi:hypothetical protein